MSLEWKPETNSSPSFSNHQWDVLKLLALGLEDFQIADDLRISWRQAREEAEAIISELGGNRTLSAIKAMRNGWVETTDLRKRLDNRSTEVLQVQFDNLLPQEREITTLVGTEGLSNEEVAGRLPFSTLEVGEHLNRILHKLNLRNRVEIAIFFFLGGDAITEERIPQPKATPSVAIQAQPIIKEKSVKRAARERTTLPARSRARRKRGNGEINLEEKRGQSNQTNKETLRIIIALLKKGVDDLDEIREILSYDPDEIREILLSLD